MATKKFSFEEDWKMNKNLREFSLAISERTSELKI
jgi:hypothetical protein